MIVNIEKYSFKTGRGLAIDSSGKEIPFTYRQFKNEKAIPIGAKADFKNQILSPGNKFKSLIFYLLKSIQYIRSKYNGNN